MKRLGFTIVEITIVLLLIGIIAGMAYKSSKLLETARMRGEAGKLHSFENGFLAYFQRHNKLPDYDNITYYPYVKQKLIDTKVVSPGDFLAEFAKAPNTGSNCPTIYNEWSFRGNIVVNNTLNTFVYNSSSNPQIENAGVCHSLASYFLCFLESVMDDEDSTGGVGRAMTDDKLENLDCALGKGVPGCTKKNCDMLSKDEYIDYMYLVFAPMRSQSNP